MSERDAKVLRMTDNLLELFKEGDIGLTDAMRRIGEAYRKADAGRSFSYNGMFEADLCDTPVRAGVPDHERALAWSIGCLIDIKVFGRWRCPLTEPARHAMVAFGLEEDVHLAQELFKRISKTLTIFVKENYNPDEFASEELVAAPVLMQVWETLKADWESGSRSDKQSLLERWAVQHHRDLIEGIRP